MKSHWVGVTPNSMTIVLIRRRKETHIHTQKTMQCEDGDRLKLLVCRPRNTKDCHQPVESRRKVGNIFSLRNSTRNQPCWLLDFKNCLTNHIYLIESTVVVKWDPADSCKYYRCLAHAKILVSSSRSLEIRNKPNRSRQLCASQAKRCHPVFHFDWFIFIDKQQLQC